MIDSIRTACEALTPLALYDPIEPAIEPSSVFRHVFARAYADPEGQRHRRPREAVQPLPSLDGTVLVFDTETVEHALTFGVLEIYERRQLKTRAVFYRDDLPVADPASFERLKTICVELDVKLISREWLFQNGIWLARKHGWTIAGFNLAYDLSRITDGYEAATKTGRLGARYCNGFMFTKRLTNGVVRPWLRIKRDDRHHVRYDARRAVVLDLATWAFAFTDRNHSLQSACRAFGVAFEQRPGLHSGEITRENVEGCLYDVSKTSELFWALDKEHGKHPIALHPPKAQSGAALAKAYLKAIGVRPRLDVQPDFPKDYLGYAAQAYFGGRVEARIVKTVVPCVYLDFLSMYPTVFALLGLWRKHITPARLEVEEIPPAEIERLLSRICENPESLFEKATWQRLDFFALVETDSATLPARALIPTTNVSRNDRLAAEAARIYENDVTAQAAFWAALDDCGGKIIPDMSFDRKRRRWGLAGEFLETPRGLLARNRKRPASGKAFGNIDELTQHVRDALDDQELTTSDVLDFFAKHPQRPSLADARRRAREGFISGDNEEEHGASNRVVTVGPVESEQPLWYAGPDLAAAAIAGGKPRVVQAWRLRPHDVQEALKPILFRGEDPIDPRNEDFFVRLIELRKSNLGDALDNERKKTGYKVVANSGAYGIFAETSPIDADPDAEHRKPRRVAVYADAAFVAEVDRPERHGRYNFFPTASLVTAGARLLLALAQREVERAGGEVAYCDTDSLVIVSSKEGSFVPCEGGPYRLHDGTRAIRALPRFKVEAIRERFASLSPYDSDIIPPGTLLKLEDENFAAGEPTRHCELWCYAVSEKSYALFELDDDGEPVIRKFSAHTLGQYRSPIPGDRQGWVSDAWKREIRAALGKPVGPLAGEQHPAIAQLTLSTWNVVQPYRENTRLRPFDFLAVSVVDKSPLANGAYNEAADRWEPPKKCCVEPRPACTLFANVADWGAQEWRCLRCGEPWDVDVRRPLKTYAQMIRSTLQGFEHKRLRADGGEPILATMRGLTIPRPVRVESKTAIGKEVIVDPTDTDEGLTAEMLSETNVQQYLNSAEEFDALRVSIRTIGIRLIARNAGVSRSQVKRFLNQIALPRKSTVGKLKKAVIETAPLQATTPMVEGKQAGEREGRA